MAVGNNFAKVREVFCSNLAENLRRLNVEIKSLTPKGDWLQVKCPFCSDTNGSASCSIQSGFLRCHQCGAKEDLFSWVGKAIGAVQPWQQCQALAKVIGVEVEGVPRGKGLFKVVPEMTAENLSDFKQRLYEDPDQEIAREFLRRRKMWIPEILEWLPIVAWGGKIVFAQHDGEGRLRKRCRVFDPFPLNGDPKWTWNKVKGQTGRTVGFWPIIPRILEADPQIRQLILEGEWDVLAAIMHLGVLDKGWIVASWTGGGGVGIPADGIYEHMRNRETHLLYDNDVFQGLEGDVAPDDKKMAEMRTRKKAFLDVTAQSFLNNRCTVIVRAITINPHTKWGGDLRDMVNDGLQTIDDLPGYKLADCRRQLRIATRVDFNDVHKHLGEYIEFACQVAGVADEVSIKPIRSAIKCEQGQHPYCQTCKVPELAPNGVIDFTGMQDQLACAMTDTNVPRHTMERICGKPNQCKVWSLNPIDSMDGARWSAMAKEDEAKEGTRTVEILSDVAPPLSGELVVRGWLFMSANGLTPVLMCDHLEATDDVDLPIEPHRGDLVNECPTDTTEVSVIDAYLDRWASDVANNTTHIYGRRDMHVALGLTMHSTLWIDVMGARRRGWLDICLIGATRTGKSAAARAYLKALQLGQHFTPMGNFSRPGLTLGTISINGQQKMKPGVFPRNHGKLTVLDEAHLMVQDNASGGGLFPMLQGARDIGKVEAAKISGSQQLNAAVRLIAISNWLGGNRNSFSTPAQHLLSLYGTPESLARLDFGLPIDEIESGFGPEDVHQFWTVERQRAVAIRAWQMESSAVSFEPEALEEAKKLCTFTWKDRYSEELPLYTEKEKVFSVLRIAAAVANMTLSCHEGNLNTCRVRLVHVQWAAKWLEKTWKLLEYDSISRSAKRQMEPKLLWRVEGLFTVKLNLNDPTAVNFVIGRFYGMLGREELRAVTGFAFGEFEKWVMELVRVGAIEVVRPPGSNGFGNQLALRFTKGAIEVVQKLVLLAEHAPEVWRERYDRMSTWMAGGNGLKHTEPHNMLPIDAPIEMHLNALRQRRLDET
jgi:hypothetical protein